MNRFQSELTKQIRRIKTMMYTNEETALAHEIATALNDQKALSQHLKYVRLYSHDSLRMILEKVLSIPKDKIHTSRAAYFVSLVKQLKYYDSSRH